MAAKTIVCYGDSNTHGYNSKNQGRFDEHERWPCLLAEMLGPEYLVREEGMSGRTTVFDDPLFEGLSGLDHLYPCMMTHEPLDLLVIMLGTNDTKERFGATPENIAKGMDRLAAKALASKEAFRGEPNVLVIAPLPVGEDYIHSEVAGEMGSGCAEKSRALAPLYEAVADRLGCHFLDAGAIGGMAVYPYDSMHLSPESHRLLAETLAKMIPGLI